MEMAGKTVAVTGGANGIGRAIAEGFAARGARVAIGDLDGAKAAEVGEALGGVGMRLDAAREASMAGFLSVAERRLGPIDAFVSNAGVGVSDGPLWGAGSAPNGAWDLCWSVNVMATVYAARHLVPAMTTRGGGLFVVVASAAGLLHQVGDTPYSVTKHAAVALAEALAVAHGDAGLQVHCLCPEGVRTNLVKGIEHGSQGLSGYIEPKEVADALFAAIDAKQFRVTTHPNTEQYAAMRVAEPDRWLGGMRKIRRDLIARHGRPL